MKRAALVAVALLGAASVAGASPTATPGVTSSSIVVGAILIKFLPTEAQHISKQAPQVIEGAILVGVMLLLPGGAAGLLRLLGTVPNRRVVHSSQQP